MVHEHSSLSESHAPTAKAGAEPWPIAEPCTDQEKQPFLRVQKPRPKLLKRLSGQHILTRQKQHSQQGDDGVVTVQPATSGLEESAEISAKNASVPNYQQKPAFTISTPSITIATCQKEVMTTTTFPPDKKSKAKKHRSGEKAAEDDDTRLLQATKPTTNNEEQQQTLQDIQTVRGRRRSSTSSLYSISSSRRSSISSSSVLLTPGGDTSRIDARHKSMPTWPSLRALESSHENNGTTLFGVPSTVAVACGYTVANDKRNHDFHAIFRSVPDSDCLIDDYVCALQKEILLQGHMYVSEHHVCFKSNIFGYVTNLVIAFKDIISIEKRMTAKFIPNGIQISTLHTKHCFASLLSRDHTYDQLHKLWTMHHKRDENSRMLQPHSQSDFSIDDNDEKIASDGLHEQLLTDTSTSSSEHPLNADHHNDSEECHHKAAEIKDSINDQHQRVVTALDATYPGNVEEFFRLLFKRKLMSRFLSKYEGCRDIQFGEWKDGLRKSSYEQRFGRFRDLYIRCDQEDRLVEMDIPRTAVIESSIRLPETPFGCAVNCRSRTCISKLEECRVKVVVTFYFENSSEVAHDDVVEREAVLRQRALYSRLHRVLQRKAAKKHSERQEIEAQKIEKTIDIPTDLTNEASKRILGILSLVFVAATGLIQFLFRIRAPRIVPLCIIALVVTNVVISLRLLDISMHLGHTKSSRGETTNMNDNISFFRGSSHSEDLQIVEAKIRLLLSSLTDIQSDLHVQAQQLQFLHAAESVGLK